MHLLVVTCETAPRLPVHTEDSAISCHTRNDLPHQNSKRNHSSAIAQLCPFS